MDNCVDCGKPSGGKILCGGCSSKMNGTAKPKTPTKPAKTKQFGAYGKAPGKPKAPAPVMKPVVKKPAKPTQPGSLAAALTMKGRKI